MTKKELVRLEKELQRHGYRKGQPYESDVLFVWRKNIDNIPNATASTEYWVWDNSDIVDNPRVEVEAVANIETKKWGFNVKTKISSRENMDILQIEGIALSMLNLYK